MPALQSRRWTAEEVRLLPEEPGKQFEVIDGELFVTPSPSYPHQYVALHLWGVLSAYLSSHRVGVAVAAPLDVEIDPHTLVQPDVFVLPRVGGRKPSSWEDAGRLLLAVEVLSPSSARKDRVKKRALYQRVGTEYWIVDWEARLIERWLPGDDRPEILTERLAWAPEGTVEPLVIELPAMFRAALDD